MRLRAFQGQRTDLSTAACGPQREVTNADDKLKRLYRLIEDGMTEMDDVLKDGLNSLKADRDRTKAAGTSKTALIPSHPDRSCVAGKDVARKSGPAQPERGHSGFADEC